jgi:hypothetical protein
MVEGGEMVYVLKRSRQRRLWMLLYKDFAWVPRAKSSANNGKRSADARAGKRNTLLERKQRVKMVISWFAVQATHTPDCYIENQD